VLLDCVIYCAFYSILFKGGGVFFRSRCIDPDLINWINFRQLVLWMEISAVTILKSKSKINDFLSQSVRIEIAIFAKSLLRFILAAITGCC